MNCIKRQIASYLNLKKVPIELLFYNTFEKTAFIFEEFIFQGSKCWTYHTNTLNEDDLKELGVYTRKETHPSFDEVIQDIKEGITNNIPNFLILNEYYLPFRDCFRKHFGLHCISTWGFNEHNEDELYIISLLPLFDGYVHQDSLNKAFQTCPYKYTWTYEITKVNYNQKTEFFIHKFMNWLSTFEDDFSYYDDIQDLLVINLELKGKQAFYTSISDAFTMLMGSRHLLALFLKQINAPNFLHDELMECTLYHEEVRNMLYKNFRPTTNNINQIAGNCKIIKNKEIKILNNLKDVFHSKKRLELV